MKLVKCNKSKGCHSGKACCHYRVHKWSDACVGEDIPCDTHDDDGAYVLVTCVEVDKKYLKSDPRIYDKAQLRLPIKKK